MVSAIDYVFEKISHRKDNRFGIVYCCYRSGRNVRRISLGVYVTEDDWAAFSSYWKSIANMDSKYTDDVKKVFTDTENVKLAECIVSTLGITNERFAYIMNDIKERLLCDDSFLCTDDIVPLIVNTRMTLHLLDRFRKIDGEKRRRIKNISMLKCMDKFVSDKESGRLLKEGTLQKVTDSYIRSLRVAVNHLRSFERFHGEKITLEDVTMELRDEYVDWCRSKGLSTNTIVQRVEAIHCVMKLVYEEGLTENAIHAHSCFVPKPEKVGSILISRRQLQDLYELDLSTEEKINELVENCHIGKRRMERYKPLLTSERISLIEQARDIFVVGCLTGQRYSDYKRMNANMVFEMNGVSFIGIVQQKTRRRVVIPLDERVVEILDRYGNDGLPDLSVNKVNECLHLIGELLQWTWKPDFNGNAPHSQIGIRFCDLMTSHTARRSFATNAYANRVPVESIMAVTGHASELRLRGYVRDAPEASAEIVAKDFEGFLEL